MEGFSPTHARTEQPISRSDPTGGIVRSRQRFVRWSEASQQRAMLPASSRSLSAGGLALGPL